MHTDNTSDRIKSDGSGRNDWFARVRRGFGILTELIFPKSNTEKLLDILGPEKVADMIPHVEIAEDDLVPSARDAHAVWPYRHPLAESIIHLVKSGGDRAAAECSGVAAWRYIEQHLLVKIKSDEIILVPIPLSPRRRRQRGYNQSEWIAEAIAKHSDPKKVEAKVVMRTDILKRTAHGTRQALKNRKERQASVEQHIFRAMFQRNECIATEFIIIDDVITTGSTLAAAREALVAAGVMKEHIHILAVAH